MGIWRSALLAAALGLLGTTAAAADRLILRNLEIISGRTVVRFDEDGVVLDGERPGGGTRVTWDEIERGRVAKDQKRFDALLADLGLPLFRVRQRLKTGDYLAAGEVAEVLYPRLAERKSQTAYLVCQAVVWSRLASGRREEAVEPQVRCCELLRTGAARTNDLPGGRRPRIAEPTALSSELAPVWLDPEAAKTALPKVEAAIRGMSNPRPAGVYLYYATLAIAAGQASEAERMLPLLEQSGGDAKVFADLVRAQQELAGGAPGPASERLMQQLAGMPDGCRLAAYYCLGLAGVGADDEGQRREGVLWLLRLPAAYGDVQPELAAAALYQAAAGLDKLKDRAGAAAVRGELASRYSGTRFARLAEGQAGQ